MSRRARAAGFAGAAAVCAGIAAGATGGEPAGGQAQFGDLQDVVVAARPLARGEPLREPAIARALEIRRVPERFVPPDSLVDPAQAVGRTPATSIPAGGYLLGSQLATGDAGASPRRRLGAGRRPVEITVQAAGALAATEASEAPARGRVDVVVTSEPGPGGGSGRTYVAARSVALLDLRPAGRDAAAPADALAGSAAGSWVATLALTRAQALDLIHAESFARGIRLIGS